MWPVQIEKLPSAGATRYVFTGSAYCEVLEYWTHNEQFRTFFSGLLAESDLGAFAWETPALHEGNLDQRFEFVLTESPRLNLATPSPQSFAQHFRRSEEERVVTFPNLGGDALLVVPRPLMEHQVYGHLAAFVRLAPKEQLHSFWKAISEAVERRLNKRPIWLSTAGLGVPWLHARIDNTPKYYRHRPYGERNF